MKKILILCLMFVMALSFNVLAADIVSTDGSPDGNGIYPLAVDSAGSIVAKTINFAADTASSDAYAIALSPAIASYTTGQMIVFTAVTANTGACTVNVNGLGAKALLSLNDVVPPNSYIEAGSVVVAVYDGTSFLMIQPDANP